MINVKLNLKKIIQIFYKFELHKFFSNVYMIYYSLKYLFKNKMQNLSPGLK